MPSCRSWHDALSFFERGPQVALALPQGLLGLPLVRDVLDRAHRPDRAIALIVRFASLAHEFDLTGRQENPVDDFVGCPLRE